MAEILLYLRERAQSERQPPAPTEKSHILNGCWHSGTRTFTSELGTSKRSATGSPAVWELAWACGLTGAGNGGSRKILSPSLWHAP